MKQPTSQLSAAILAGGKSSRFGRNKADMEFSGQRLLMRLIDMLRYFPLQNLAVVVAPGQQCHLPASITLLRDDREGLGPMGGIATALRRLPGGVLVVACDMPLVSRELVQWLLDCYDPRWDAVIPRHPGGIEPLMGIYLKSFLPFMEEAIGAGRYALHFLLEESNVRFVEVPKTLSDEFANVNTQEDYIRLQKAATKKT